MVVINREISRVALMIPLFIEKNYQAKKENVTPWISLTFKIYVK